MPDTSPRHLRRLAALTATSLLAGTSYAGTSAFFPTWIEHYGYEQIIAGPNVDPAHGLQTTGPSHLPVSVALSDNGTRVWFVLYYAFGNPQYQVWSMLANGTGEEQSALPAGTFRPNGNMRVHTDGVGAIAVLDDETKFSRALPGQALELLFDRTGTDFGISEGQLRLTKDGSRFLYLDRWNTRVYTVDLEEQNPQNVLLADRPFFTYMGGQPRSSRGFDMSDSGAEWFITAENHFFDVNRQRHWINHGTGAVGSPTLDQPPTPTDERAPLQVETTRDGEVMFYCPQYGFQEGTGYCYWQNTATDTRVTFSDPGHLIGKPVLADNGSRVYLTNDVGGPSLAYSYFQDLVTHRRRVGGTQRLAGYPTPFFDRAELSERGDVLAAPTSLGVYVLHEGLAAPLGFPRVLSFLHRYDASDDELIVQVVVDPADGIERIYTLPLFNGVEPTRLVPQAENPFFGERSGGGVNWSTTFTQIGPITWERRIDMDGKYGFLTREYALRIVVVDQSGDRTAFYDFRPNPFGLYADEFETGDLSGWSAVVGELP